VHQRIKLEEVSGVLENMERYANVGVTVIDATSLVGPPDHVRRSDTAGSRRAARRRQQTAATPTPTSVTAP